MFPIIQIVSKRECFGYAIKKFGYKLRTLQKLSIYQNVLKVKITNGSHIGNIALNPRIELTPSETSLLFRMSRRQFPITFFQPHKPLQLLPFNQIFLHDFILIQQFMIVINTSLSIT